MKTLYSRISYFLWTFCTLGLLAFNANAQLFNQDSLKLISGQFAFTEGPAVNSKGEIFFTDQPNNQIWKYDGRLTMFMDKAGRANGLYFDRKGQLLTCADENNELWSINKEGKVKILLRNVEGKKLNGPNDLWADAKGGIYFTDPYYQRDYWVRQKPEIEGQKVYYLPPGHNSQARVVAEDVSKPNGIVGTADGKFLYVADIQGNKTYKYTISNDGSLSNQILVVQQGADGITLDNKGNLYLTGNGITIYNPEGQQIGHINMKERPSNLCFFGKNRSALFITARKTIYVLPMLGVRGVE